MSAAVTTTDPYADEDHDLIRTEIRRLCDAYGNEYWRSLEPDRYPREFVSELTEQGWLGSLIPVEYGGAAGPDLAAVAAHTGLSADEVVARHAGGEYVVFFVGFQPGFAYLGGLDPALHTPRRAAPRLEVPAGSVGIGGAQTVIYPATAPGGWQLIGRTSQVLFDPARPQPTLLLPGDRVHFTIAGVDAT